MPVIRIDLASPVPAYRQIANAIRALLVSGAFPIGEPLPTVRQLAVDLGVHHNTVAEAYRVLSEEGWLDLRRRHGAIVLDRSRPRPSREARPSLVQRLRELDSRSASGRARAWSDRRRHAIGRDGIERGQTERA